jgi:hypothetical protein
LATVFSGDKPLATGAADFFVGELAGVDTGRFAGACSGVEAGTSAGLGCLGSGAGCLTGAATRGEPVCGVFGVDTGELVVAGAKGLFTGVETGDTVGAVAGAPVSIGVLTGLRIGGGNADGGTGPMVVSTQ